MVLCKFNVWQVKSVIKNKITLLKTYFITSILYSPPHRTWGKAATPKIPSERMEIAHRNLLRHKTTEKGGRDQASSDTAHKRESFILIVGTLKTNTIL